MVKLSTPVNFSPPDDENFRTTGTKPEKKNNTAKAASKNFGLRKKRIPHILNADRVCNTDNLYINNLGSEF